MKKYLFLQLKRVFKLFPFFLAVTLVMVIACSMIFSGIIDRFGSDKKNNRFKIAISGDTDNEYLKWGMAAMQSFDESEFAIEFLEFDEKEAEQALLKGELSAYVVLPEDFIENAIHGEVEPVKYVTTAGMDNVVTMLKSELTRFVTDVVVYSQKGSYGIYDAMKDRQISGAGQKLDTISIEYVEFIFNRSEMYHVNELGFSDGMSLTEYFICGLSVLLLLLVSLPYAVVYIKKDNSLGSLMISRGYSGLGQLFCEFVSHFASMIALVLTLLLFGAVAGNLFSSSLSTIFEENLADGFFARFIFVLLLIAAFNIFVFEITDNIVSGVLVHFFATISMCYISGCMYPINALPEVVRMFSVFLPTGVARGFLAGSYTGEGNIFHGVMILLYIAVFFFGAFLVRKYKTESRRG